MKSSLNILIEKDEIGYTASCSQIEGYKVTAKSFDLVISNLKTTIKNYLDQDNFAENIEQNNPIWEVAKQLVEEITEEEKKQLPSDGAKQHDHF